MKELVAIYDSDILYERKLCDCLNALGGLSFETICFREAKADEAISLLLLDESAEQDEINCLNVRETALLSEAREYAGGNRRKSVCKYQAVPEIAKEIENLLKNRRERAENTEAEKKTQRFIGVASPIGRCGKSAFCTVLGRLLSENERVLSVSFDIFGEEGREMGRPAFDFSDFLYAVHAGTSPEALSASYTVRENGVDSIPAARLPEDIYRTEPAEIAKAIRLISEAKPYDTVILDLGTEMRLIEAFLPMLACLVVPTKADSAAKAKCEAFLQWARRKNPGLSAEMPVFPLDMPVAGAGNAADRLLFGALGDYVRAMKL